MNDNVIPMPGTFQMPPKYAQAFHSPNMAGSELRAFREELGFTQYELARILGMSGQSVARWEKGSVPKTVQIFVWLLVYEARAASEVPRETRREADLSPRTEDTPESCSPSDGGER